MIKSYFDYSKYCESRGHFTFHSVRNDLELWTKDTEDEGSKKLYVAVDSKTVVFARFAVKHISLYPDKIPSNKGEWIAAVRAMQTNTDTAQLPPEPVFGYTPEEVAESRERYLKGVTERREARHAQWAREDEERERVKMERRSKEIDALKSCAINGERLTGEQLIDLTRILGINEHPRTIGMIRKRVIWMEIGQSCISGKGFLPQSAYRLYKTIRERIANERVVTA